MLPSCLLVPGSATSIPASSRPWLCGQDSVAGSPAGSTPPSRAVKSSASSCVLLRLTEPGPVLAPGSPRVRIRLCRCRVRDLPRLRLPHVAERGSGCLIRRPGPGVSPPLHAGIRLQSHEGGISFLRSLGGGPAMGTVAFSGSWRASPSLLGEAQRTIKKFNLQSHAQHTRALPSIPQEHRWGT